MSFASKIMGNCSNYLKKLDKKDLVWRLLSHQFRMFSVVYTVFATVAELSACSTITKFATTMLKNRQMSENQVITILTNILRVVRITNSEPLSINWWSGDATAALNYI